MMSTGLVSPISTGKANNTSALVSVQGGVLSIPQLVAELSRLIPEKWNWEVTEHEKKNSFIVPFPSRGDLLRSVAFEKAHIKEHNVDLLFEWQPEEEGFPLPRVWIRIFRLPSKLVSSPCWGQHNQLIW
jgi:hypothetical protein